MWSSIDRTRRRLLRSATSPQGASTEGAVLEDAGTKVQTEPVADVVLAIGRPEFDRLGQALQAMLGPDVARPDTPARLEAALTTAVERLGGAGVLHVRRRPAGLYTPEAWQVHIETVDPTIVDAIRHAIREGAFAA